MVDAGEPVTSARSQSIVLALNSGSSSLKFGLYRVSGLRTEDCSPARRRRSARRAESFMHRIRKGVR